MMHDRTFLARLCVDIDGVNMLVILLRWKVANCDVLALLEGECPTTPSTSKKYNA